MGRFEKLGVSIQIEKEKTMLQRKGVFFIVSLLFLLQGCSVIMAARQPSYKDLNALSKGTPRSKVIAELGTPILTEERDGKKVDIFAFTQGYGKGNKTARAFFHAAADVWTLGLWEVIGTPTEIIASGKKIQMEVTYNANDEVEEIKSMDKKPSPDTQKEPTFTEKAKEPLNKNPQPIENKEGAVIESK